LGGGGGGGGSVLRAWVIVMAPGSRFVMTDKTTDMVSIVNQSGS
jgi:hypothetical protein